MCAFRHCDNALKVAEFLKSHEKVAWAVLFLPGDKYYALAKKYLPNGSCGVISFGLKGGRAAAEAMMEKPASRHHTHVADARTSILHPPAPPTASCPTALKAAAFSI